MQSDSFADGDNHRAGYSLRFLTVMVTIGSLTLLQSIRGLFLVKPRMTSLNVLAVLFLRGIVCVGFAFRDLYLRVKY